MNVAIEILEKVYSDCCKNSERGEKSEEVVYDFCHSLIQLQKIKERLCEIKGDCND